MLEFRRRTQGDQLAFVQDGEAVAALGFFHQVSGDDDRDAFLISEDLQVLPEIATGARIEAGRRLVQQQDRWMMQQTFCELDAASHASRKSLDQFFHAIG